MAQAFTALIFGLANLLTWLFTTGGALADLIGVTAVSYLARKSMTLSIVAVSITAIVTLSIACLTASYALINTVSVAIGSLPSWMLPYMQFICPPHINLFLSIGITANALITATRILFLQIKLIQKAASD